jgi:hypothetical protein
MSKEVLLHFGRKTFKAAKGVFWWKMTIFANLKYVVVGFNVVKMAQNFTGSFSTYKTQDKILLANFGMF